MAQRFCKVCRGWHDLDQPWPLACIKIEPDKRGPYRIHVISDTMQPVQGQHDGKIYDSKAQLRSSYRAHGLLEVGNDAARLRTPKAPQIDRTQIRASLERAKSRVALTS
jgi:hypothetical protein